MRRQEDGSVHAVAKGRQRVLVQLDAGTPLVGGLGGLGGQGLE